MTILQAGFTTARSWTDCGDPACPCIGMPDHPFEQQRVIVAFDDERGAVVWEDWPLFKDGDFVPFSLS